MTQPYQHEPLEEGANQFRLLQLLPGDDDSIIECRLYIFDRNDCPPYEALSYVWGDETNMQDIIMNGERFSIRDNLWRFLRRARAQEITQVEVPEPHEKVPSNSTTTDMSLNRNTTPAVYKPGFLWIDQICIDQTSMAEKSEQVSSMADVYTGSQRTVV